MVMRRHALDGIAIIAEPMEMHIAGFAPVAKLDAQLEGAVGARDEIGFVDAEHGVELGDERHRRLTDADRSDVVGFDQDDLGKGRRQEAREQCGRHPSRGPAAGDHDPADGRLRSWKTVYAIRRATIPKKRPRIAPGAQGFRRS